MQVNIHRLKKSEFLHAVTVLISGNVLAQVITLVNMPIVSRIYSVRAFGEFAIFSSTASIVGGVAALGLGSAIMAPKDDVRAKDVFYTAFIAMLFIVTAFFIVLLLLSSCLTFHHISIPHYKVCVLLYVFLVLNGFSSILTIYVNRLKQNRLLFWNALISALATSCITIPLGLLGWGISGFITSAICAALLANLQMLIRINPFYKILSMKQVISVLKEFKEYVYFQFPSNLLSTFSVQLPNQIFSPYFGNVALGSYSMCEKVMGYPIRLIAAPISTIYFRHATQLLHEDRVNDLGKFSLRLMNRILLVAFIPVVCIMGFSEKLFIFILGDKWGPAGTIAAILTMQYVLLFCNQCLSYCLVVLNKQKINLYFSLLQFTLIIVSIITGIFVFESLLGAILFFAIGNMIVQILSLSFIFYYLNRSLRVILKPVGLFIGATLSLSLVIRVLLF